MIKIIETLELTEKQKRKVCSLWNEEYPQQLNHVDLESFNQYLKQVAPVKHYLLDNSKGVIEGWAFLFEREKECWFALILAEGIQGKGYGTKLLQKLQEAEKQLNGWVIDHNTDKKLNGDVYRSPLPFYLKNKFTILQEQRLETDRISAVKIVWNKN